MLEPKNPCRCKPPKRNGTCHSVCEEYKQYIKDLSVYNELVHAERNKYYSAEVMSQTTYKRNRKARGK